MRVGSIGTSVTLTCIVEGYPAPDIPTLTKTGDGTNYNLQCFGTNKKTCIYVFNPVQYTDKGNYKCDGKNTIDGNDHTSSASTYIVVRKLFGI